MINHMEKGSIHLSHLSSSSWSPRYLSTTVLDYPAPDQLAQTRRKWKYTVSHSVVFDSATPGTVAPPGSSFNGILQARMLEWVAIPFARGSSESRDRTWVSGIADRFFTIWVTREAQGLERSSGEGNSYPLQHSCLENPMDRGAWWATVHGVTKSLTWLGNQDNTDNLHFPWSTNPPDTWTKSEFCRNKKY